MYDMTQDTAMSDAQAQEAVLGYLLNADPEQKQDEQGQGNVAPSVDQAAVEAGYSATLQDGEAPEKTVEAAEEKEVEAEQEPGQETETELSFETIDQVAEAAGMPLEEFIDKVKGRVKIDGKESEVTLKEALAGYQREADYTRKTQEVAQQRQEVAKRQEQLAQMENVVQAAVMDDPFAVEEQRLAQEYNSVNWAELRDNSDGSFADTQAAFQQRHQQLQYLRNQRAQRLQQASRQLYEQKVQLGREELKNRLQGGLTDEQSQKVSEVLAEVGYTQGELNNFTDYRAVLLAHKILQSKAISETVQSAEGKRVARKTPVLRPGAAKGAGEVSQQRQKALIQRAQKTQSDEAWADVLVNLGV